jgi:nucleotide-binding universal stress UspA family protein
MNVRRILLPLDGSDLAEIAIAPAIFYALTFGATLLLLHIVEQDAPRSVHGGSRHITDEREAGEYLQQLAASKFPRGLEVEIHVHSAAVRDVTRSITDHVSECGADAIVMCAHGKGNPRQWLVGNNAQQIIAHGKTPVFFLPASFSTPEKEFSISQIILPTDGLPGHERGATWAEYVAQRCHVPMNMVMVVPTSGDLTGEHAATRTLLPTSTLALLEIQAQQAAEILSTQADRMRSEGLSVTTEVLRGDPAEQLARFVHKSPSGLIVLGTHGHAGNAAFWNRSLTARILPRLVNPMLLIPV